MQAMAPRPLLFANRPASGLFSAFFFRAVAPPLKMNHGKSNGNSSSDLFNGSSVFGDWRRSQTQ
jgi:hypothetical protein